MSQLIRLYIARPFCSRGVWGGEQGSSFGSAAVVYGENARKPSARRASVRSPVVVKSRQRDSRWCRKLRAGRRVFKTVGSRLRHK